MSFIGRRLLLAAAIAAIALTPWTLEWVGLPLSVGLGVSLGASVTLVAVLLLKSSRDQAVRSARIYDASWTQYAQLEAMISLVDFLKPVQPLPQTRNWAASPDLLRLLCQQVQSRRPEQILELGSGISTLVLAYCLKRRGSGKLLALEHEPMIAERTHRWLVHHGLEEFAEVRHAPLASIQVAGEDWPWYELSGLETRTIDFVFVDGPPANLRSMARYPALSLLRPMLAQSATIVLDDARRTDESQIVRRWCRENPGLDADYRELEKGAVVLRWVRD